MNYPSGEQIEVGDRVSLGGDNDAKVVCDIDAGVYTEKHPREQWSYLKTGIMVDSPKYGLMHMTQPDEDLRLISRAL